MKSKYHLHNCSHLYFFFTSFSYEKNMLKLFRVWTVHGSVILWPIKTTDILNTHSLNQFSCSTCCHCIAVIIGSEYIHTTSPHQLAVHIVIHRIRSKISQSGNGEATAWVKTDFMSKGRLVKICFIMPS